MANPNSHHRLSPRRKFLESTQMDIIFVLASNRWKTRWTLISMYIIREEKKVKDNQTELFSYQPK